MGILSVIWERLFGRKKNVGDGMVPIFPEVTTRTASVKPQSANDNPGLYRPFTRKFDRVIEAADLVTFFGDFGPVGLKRRDEAWQAFQDAMQTWRMRVHLKALKSSGILRKKTTDADRAKITVTLLVDQSGSMRGQKMMLAVASVDIAQDYLRNLGITVEILGFTTSSWRGGQSRKKWLAEGRRRNPGRLCDLLHIVYRSADDMRAASGEHTLKYMTWPELPKENVDGEALEWAADRMRARPEPRKILIVISDGAPVDDSTLAANDAAILHRHLVHIIEKLKHEPGFIVAAIGIGFDVTCYYSRAKVVQAPDDLGTGLITLLQQAVLQTLPP